MLEWRDKAGAPTVFISMYMTSTHPSIVMHWKSVILTRKGGVGRKGELLQLLLGLGQRCRQHSKRFDALRLLHAHHTGRAVGVSLGCATQALGFGELVLIDWGSMNVERG